MGFGVPSAIGAKVAAPEKIVVDVDGDASFQMSAMELATAAQYGIGVKILILNNNFQGMVLQWQGTSCSYLFVSGSLILGLTFRLLFSLQTCSTRSDTRTLKCSTRTFQSSLSPWVARPSECPSSKTLTPR